MIAINTHTRTTAVAPGRACVHGGAHRGVKCVRGTLLFLSSTVIISNTVRGINFSKFLTNIVKLGLQLRHRLRLRLDTSPHTARTRSAKILGLRPKPKYMYSCSSRLRYTSTSK